jgi:hypothetical protein
MGPFVGSEETVENPGPDVGLLHFCTLGLPLRFLRQTIGPTRLFLQAVQFGHKELALIPRHLLHRESSQVRIGNVLPPPVREK